MKKILLLFAILTVNLSQASQTMDEFQEYISETLTEFAANEGAGSSEIIWTSELDGKVEIKLPFKIRVILPVIQDKLHKQLERDIARVIEEDGFKDAFTKYGGSMTLDFGAFVIFIDKNSWE